MALPIKTIKRAIYIDIHSAFLVCFESKGDDIEVSGFGNVLSAKVVC